MFSKYKEKKNWCTNGRSDFFKIAEKYINLSDKILDAGAGDGAFARIIKRHDCYQLDSNLSAVKNLKKDFINVTIGSIITFPYQDNFFNVIHCSHVIEHLLPDELYKFLKEADRCLKSNGFLIISTPLLTDEFYDDLSHIKPYNHKLFERYLCWGVEDCSTRPLISKNYQKMELIYRYSQNAIGNNINNLYPFLDKIINLLMKLIYKIGFRRIEKTGYTIVLRKNISERF